MAKDEDVLPQTYQYLWSSDSDIPLHDFLTKYKPSMVQNDGAKPWIWVKGSEPSQEDQGVAPAIKEAADLLKEVTEKVESIKNDAAIPTRSNKKTGAKSKKELREQTQAEATEKLKEISIRHGYVSGKWLIFAPTDNVDKIWSNLATSLVSGPLASTCAYVTKVSTCPEEESANHQHLLCLYMPNVYDKDAVTEVMRILLRNHGLSLTGVKSNLYTSLGIDSKHASGIQSTIWKNTALLKDAEIRELKDAFFAGIKNKPAALEEKPSDKQHASSVPAAPSKPKMKLKKKPEDDPFASDGDDDGGEEEKRKVELKTKKAASATKGKRVKKSEDEGGEEEGEEERPKKRRLLVGKRSSQI